MRINMSWWLISIAVLSLAACNSSQNDSYAHEFVSGDVMVHEMFWAIDHDTPYPFTASGEIACVYYPSFGREVYFLPEGYTDESYIGTPLNKSAVSSLDKDNMSANVPYSIKQGADLSDAIQLGLKVCDEQSDMLSKL